MKCHRDMVPAGLIVAAEKCASGVQMNWVTFFVNQFLTDYKEAQDNGMKFHYAWLLILIELVSWRDPRETEFLEGMQELCLEARYVSSWNTTHKNMKMDNNVIFYIYKEIIQHFIEDTLHILPHKIEAYKQIT